MFRFCQSAFVRSTFFSKMPENIEKINTDLITLVAQHTGYCQSITTIIAGSGKDHYGYSIIPYFSDGSCQRFCCTLHQIDAGYRLVFNGKSIELFDLSTSEYLHNNCKNKKNKPIVSHSLVKNLYFCTKFKTFEL